MDQSEMKDQMQPRDEGLARPNYIEPKIKYPSYSDMSNEEKNEPSYILESRYKEYR